LAAYIRVQIFELHAIFEKCFKNKQFIKIQLKGLKILNPTAGSIALPPGFLETCHFGQK
jgi:hypothetical protein